MAAATLDDLLEEYRDLSRFPLYESSSSDDESVSSEVQRGTVSRRRRERYGEDNRVCPHLLTTDDRVQNERASELMRSAHAQGHLAVRAHQIGFRRGALSRCAKAKEVFPGWFVHEASIASWRDASAVIEFLRQQHGGNWTERTREFVADHPLRHEGCSAKLQNMKCKDFMLVSLYHLMRSNNCANSDLQQCEGDITPQFRTVLLESLRTASSAW